MGPTIGPFISGYVSMVNWRWTFWIGLIISGVSLPLVLLMPETYAPILLQRRAQRLRRETGNHNIVAQFDLQKRGIRQVLTITLTRPFRMILHESIVLFTCIYLSIVYAIFFLYFQAYPIIFQGTFEQPALPNITTLFCH